MRRVAITGLGINSAIGNDVSTFWAKVSAGEHGIRPIESVDTSHLRFKNAAEVRDFDPSAHFDSGRMGVMDRFAQFAVVSARQTSYSPRADSSGSASAGSGQQMGRPRSVIRSSRIRPS